MNPLAGRIAALLLAVGLGACGHYGPPRRAPSAAAAPPASQVQSAAPGAVLEPCDEPEKAESEASSNDPGGEGRRSR